MSLLLRCRFIVVIAFLIVPLSTSLSSSLSNAAEPSAPDPPLPILVINPDGSLPDDGSNCLKVGSDGSARFILKPPQRLKSEKRDEYPGNPIAPENPYTDTDEHEEGFDYSNRGLYIDVASMEGGYLNFDQDYLQEPAEKIRTVRSPGNEGKTICVVASKPERVESWFEVMGFHVMASTALMGSSYLSGGYFDNFADAGAVQALPHYGMLYVQLKAAADIQRQLMIRGQFSPAGSTCGAAGMFASGVPLLLNLLPAVNLNNMGLAGGYTAFWLSGLARLSLQCANHGVVTPVGEYLFPANGTFRQPGSLTLSDAWMGLGGLGTAYSTQGLKNTPYTGYVVPQAMWTKITISSTGGVRTFVRNINDRYFLKDSEILPFLSDVTTLIIIASLDDPSDVTHIYFDEYIKQMGSSAAGGFIKYGSDWVAQEQTGPNGEKLDEGGPEMREWENYFQSWIDEGVFSIGTMVTLQGATAVVPYVVAPIARLTSPVTRFGKATVASAYKTIPYINYAKDGIVKVGTVIGTAKTKVTGAARSVGSTLKSVVQKIPYSGKLAAYAPATTAKGPVRSGLSFSKGIALRVAVKHNGPSAAKHMAVVADMMSAASRPGAPFRKIFQADHRIVLDHFVLLGN